MNEQTTHKAEPRVYRRARFSICDGPYQFEGWTDGTEWNGFACPEFEKAEAEKVLAYVTVENAKCDCVMTWRYDARRDLFTSEDSTNPGEVDKWGSNFIHTPDGIKTTYGVGSWAWTWAAEPKAST